ncbi:hypothetical protein BRAO375_3660079 [Bradyrhizobium sp. ORS 375]|uniref:hypothetical protein n=1 Tax=Bradyrhizobium sp. (strain ORS 375) TaxID=566679 RepID=UPI00024069AF|nr:hypothetical protein [Bradyrhizobium sp. ORS 375]CCD94685.1 hypothetical protein BRAO375_3660079 [Bradyrhizobium sp. ORS 375]
MAEELTQRGYPLPHPDNIAREDAARIRQAIEMINDDMDGTAVPATETHAGQVRLATQDEAAQGSAANAVLTVKRTKDMILALLAVLEGTVNDLAGTTSGRDTALQTSIDGLLTKVNARVLLAGGQTLSGGFDTTGKETVMSAGTFTPDPKLSAIQNVVNNGAHSIAPPASLCTVVVQYSNGATAGALTVSGFTKVTGATFSAAQGAGHILFVTKTKDYSHLHIVAMQ